MSCRSMVLVLLSLGLCGCAVTRKTVDWSQRTATRVWDAMPWISAGAQPELTGPVSQKAVAARDLELTVRIEPYPVVLSQTRRVEAWITLKNRSKKRFVQLEFPTSQRFDANITDEKGDVIALWSEDQAFEPVPGIVGINPGEQVEYKASLGTRDLSPGKNYKLSVVFINRDDLKVELPFVPRK